MAVLAQLIDGVVAHKFEINESKTQIGRLPINDIIIDDTSVSSAHAIIERVSNPDFPDTLEYYLRDLGSTNGTEVNTKRISEATQLHHEDEVKIGFHVFKFFDEQSMNLSKTVHILE